MVPNRVLPPRSYPPGVVDRLYSHIAELALASFGVKQGLIALAAVTTGEDYLGIPAPLGFTIAIFIMGGSATWIATIALWFERLNTLLKWQRLGIGFTALAWTALVVTGIVYPKMEGISSWTTAVVAAVASWILLRVTWLFEDRVHSHIPGGVEE